jgi:hypothetical protein
VGGCYAAQNSKRNLWERNKRIKPTNQHLGLLGSEPRGIENWGVSTKRLENSIEILFIKSSITILNLRAFKADSQAT